MNIYDIPAVQVSRIMVRNEDDRIRFALGEERDVDGAKDDVLRAAFVVTPANAVAWGALLLRCGALDAPLLQAQALLQQFGPEYASALAQILMQLVKPVELVPAAVANRKSRRAAAAVSVTTT